MKGNLLLCATAAQERVLNGCESEVSNDLARAHTALHRAAADALREV
jgi:hypothetical protein